MSNNLEVTIHNFKNICRICLSREDLKPLYGNCLSSTRLVDMLKSCTVVKFTEDDGLPVKICAICINELKQAFSFAKRCETTDIILRKCLVNTKTGFANNSVQPQTIEEKEEIAKEVKQEITDVLENYMSIEVKQEVDLKKEFKSEVILPTEENILVEFEPVEEEGLKEEKIEVKPEITHRAVNDDLGNYMSIEVKQEEGVKREFKSEEISPTEEKILEDFEHVEEEGTNSQILENNSSYGDSETCADTVDESYEEDQDETYSLKISNIHSIPKDNLDSPKVQLYDSGARSYICHCGKAFFFLSNLEAHNMREHPSEKTPEKLYTCRVCSKAFIKPKGLQYHMRVHIAKKLPTYPCDFCSKSFKRILDFNGHLRSIHGDKPYVCNVCTKAFKARRTFTDHMSIHGDLPYRCNVCCKAFKKPSLLQQHLKIHTPMPNICTCCKKKFKQVPGLKLHLLKKHAGTNPYICKICIKDFKGLHQLKQHLISHIAKSPDTKRKNTEMPVERLQKLRPRYN